MAYLNDKEILLSANVNTFKGGDIITPTILDDGTQVLNIAKGIVLDKTNNEFTKKLITREITEIKTEDLEGITSIGAGAFRYCNKLTKFKAEDLEGITSIGVQAFDSCENLTEVELPTSIKTIEAQAFRLCNKLTSINLANTQLETIGRTAIACGKDLTEIALPASIKKLEALCLFYNQYLLKIRFYSQTPPETDNSALPNNLEVVEVPEGCSEAYKANEAFNKYKIVEFSI